MDGMSHNKPFDFGVNMVHNPDLGIFLRKFYHCGIGADVRILRDQLSWHMYAFSRWFSFSE